MSNQVEFHVWESSGAEVELWIRAWLKFLPAGQKVLDVGCGEGHIAAALVRMGYDVEGVDVTPALVERARAKGIRVHCGDAVQLIKERGSEFGAFLFMDVLEHVPFDLVIDLLTAVPKGVCIIQTPNTNSLLGHQFYLQVPSHITPLSPMVLQKALERCGLREVHSTTLYGGLPWTGWRRRITEFVLVKLLGSITTRMLSEGANYFVVGRKD